MPTIQKKHAYHSNRVKLAVHFERKQESVCPLFTPKSTWAPPEGALPHQVKDLIQADIHHLHNNLQIGWVKRNLESFEVEALSLLRKNKHIS